MELKIGDLVYIKDELSESMSHFDCGEFTIISKRRDDSYMTTIGGWYDFDDLILIKRNPNHKLLNKLKKCNPTKQE